MSWAFTDGLVGQEAQRAAAGSPTERQYPYPPSEHPQISATTFALDKPRTPMDSSTTHSTSSPAAGMWEGTDQCMDDILDSVTDASSPTSKTDSQHTLAGFCCAESIDPTKLVGGTIDHPRAMVIRATGDATDTTIDYDAVVPAGLGMDLSTLPAVHNNDNFPRGWDLDYYGLTFDPEAPPGPFPGDVGWRALDKEGAKWWPVKDEEGKQKGQQQRTQQQSAEQQKAEQLKADQLRSQQKKALERDKFTCQCCGLVWFGRRLANKYLKRGNQAQGVRNCLDQSDRPSIHMDPKKNLTHDREDTQMVWYLAHDMADGEPCIRGLCRKCRVVPSLVVPRRDKLDELDHCCPPPSSENLRPFYCCIMDNCPTAMDNPGDLKSHLRSRKHLPYLTALICRIRDGWQLSATDKIVSHQLMQLFYDRAGGGQKTMIPTTAILQPTEISTKAEMNEHLQWIWELMPELLNIKMVTYWDHEEDYERTRAYIIPGGPDVSMLRWQDVKDDVHAVPLKQKLKMDEYPAPFLSVPIRLADGSEDWLEIDALTGGRIKKNSKRLKTKGCVSSAVQAERYGNYSQSVKGNWNCAR